MIINFTDIHFTNNPAVDSMSVFESSRKAMLSVRINSNATLYFDHTAVALLEEILEKVKELAPEDITLEGKKSETTTDDSIPF